MASRRYTPRVSDTHPLPDTRSTAEATRALRREPISAPLSINVQVVGAVALPATLTLSEGSCVLGAAPGCDVVIDEPTVSRRHVELSLVPEGVAVRDLNSRNGTFFLGQRIERAVLAPGSEISVGSARVRLELGALTDIASDTDADNYRGMLGRSVIMLKLFAILRRLEGSLVNVLVEGESGTGKELVARAIHQGSSVASGQLVTVNCGALDRELVKSELFGHRKGAFTGANESRAGAFELADGGTLFLDEVGELPLDVQPVLLRVLEAREVTRVGENVAKPVRVRVIAATNRNLDQARANGTFREDLFYRLAVVRLELPRLAQRRRDIPLLARQFALSAGATQLPDEFLASLEAHDWPGNARELRNAVEAFLAIGMLPEPAPSPALSGALDSWLNPALPYARQKDALVATFTRQYLEKLLEHTGGNQSEAARISGLERSYLGKLATKMGIKR